MSRAKKTKRTKEYSRINLYRHFEELSRRTKKKLAQQDTRSTQTPAKGDQKNATGADSL